MNTSSSYFLANYKRLKLMAKKKNILSYKLIVTKKGKR